MSETKPDRVQFRYRSFSPEEMWRTYLSEGHWALVRKMPLIVRPWVYLESGLMRLLPSDPRCIYCHAPFHGLGSPLMRAIGKGRSSLNPSLCADCEGFARKYEVGAEVDVTLLFADVRGSTSIAEQMGASEFSQLISRFFSASTDVIVRSHGFIDKLVGDEVTGFFTPGLAGADHSGRAIAAAKEILAATGHGSTEGPWIPVGVGVHTGTSFVGAVGTSGGVTDITVLGNVPNTAAHITSLARPGEILISRDAAVRADVDTSGLETRTLELKGKSEPVQVWVLGPGTPG